MAKIDPLLEGPLQISTFESLDATISGIWKRQYIDKLSTPDYEYHVSSKGRTQPVKYTLEHHADDEGSTVLSIGILSVRQNRLIEVRRDLKRHDFPTARQFIYDISGGGLFPGIFQGVIDVGDNVIYALHKAILDRDNRDISDRPFVAEPKILKFPSFNPNQPLDI